MNEQAIPNTEARVSANWWWPFVTGILGVLIGAGIAAQPERSSASRESQAILARIQVVESTTQRLTTELEDLRKRQPYLASLATTPRTLRLNVSSQSYALLDTNLGVVLVVVDNVEPYGDGQRLTLRVGNPHSADFVGFTATFAYGVDRTEQQEFTNRLNGGRWTRFQVVLPNLSAGDLDSIIMSLQMNVVGLG